LNVHGAGVDLRANVARVPVLSRLCSVAMRASEVTGGIRVSLERSNVVGYEAKPADIPEPHIPRSVVLPVSDKRRLGWYAREWTA
jgi:hypothetical protein